MGSQQQQQHQFTMSNAIPVPQQQSLMFLSPTQQNSQFQLQSNQQIAQQQYARQQQILNLQAAQQSRLQLASVNLAGQQGVTDNAVQAQLMSTGVNVLGWRSDYVRARPKIVAQIEMNLKQRLANVSNVSPHDIRSFAKNIEESAWNTSNTFSEYCQKANNLVQLHSQELQAKLNPTNMTSSNLNQAKLASGQQQVLGGLNPQQQNLLHQQQHLYRFQQQEQFAGLAQQTPPMPGLPLQLQSNSLSGSLQPNLINGLSAGQSLFLQAGLSNAGDEAVQQQIFNLQRLQKLQHQKQMQQLQLQQHMQQTNQTNLLLQQHSQLQNQSPNQPSHVLSQQRSQPATPSGQSPGSFQNHTESSSNSVSLPVVSSPIASNISGPLKSPIGNVPALTTVAQMKANESASNGQTRNVSQMLSSNLPIQRMALNLSEADKSFIKDTEKLTNLDALLTQVSESIKPLPQESLQVKAFIQLFRMFKIVLTDYVIQKKEIDQEKFLFERERVETWISTVNFLLEILPRVETPGFDNSYIPSINDQVAKMQKYQQDTDPFQLRQRQRPSPTQNTLLSPPPNHQQLQNSLQFARQGSLLSTAIATNQETLMSPTQELQYQILQQRANNAAVPSPPTPSPSISSRPLNFVASPQQLKAFAAHRQLMALNGNGNMVGINVQGLQNGLLNGMQPAQMIRQNSITRNSGLQINAGNFSLQSPSNLVINGIGNAGMTRVLSSSQTEPQSNVLSQQIVMSPGGVIGNNPFGHQFSNTESDGTRKKSPTSHVESGLELSPEASGQNSISPNNQSNSPSNNAPGLNTDVSTQLANSAVTLTTPLSIQTAGLTGLNTNANDINTQYQQQLQMQHQIQQRQFQQQIQQQQFQAHQQIALQQAQTQLVLQAQAQAQAQMKNSMAQIQPNVFPNQPAAVGLPGNNMNIPSTLNQTATILTTNPTALTVNNTPTDKSPRNPSLLDSESALDPWAGGLNGASQFGGLEEANFANSLMGNGGNDDGVEEFFDFDFDESLNENSNQLGLASPCVPVNSLTKTNSTSPNIPSNFVTSGMKRGRSEVELSEERPETTAESTNKEEDDKGPRTRQKTEEMVMKTEKLNMGVNSNHQNGMKSENQLFNFDGGEEKDIKEEEDGSEFLQF
ncbi:hypothetical protein HK098_000262 [Nowakowskiella sp. JEL0407]|nr:hypothetical protein HK098_000262 [Nowakowskiella sp. JEL0407]